MCLTDAFCGFTSEDHLFSPTFLSHKDRRTDEDLVAIQAALPKGGPHMGLVSVRLRGIYMPGRMALQGRTTSHAAV